MLFTSNYMTLLTFFFFSQVLWKNCWDSKSIMDHTSLGTSWNGQLRGSYPGDLLPAAMRSFLKLSVHRMRQWRFSNPFAHFKSPIAFWHLPFVHKLYTVFKSTNKLISRDVTSYALVSHCGKLSGDTYPGSNLSAAHGKGRAYAKWVRSLGSHLKYK